MKIDISKSMYVHTNYTYAAKADTVATAFDIFAINMYVHTVIPTLSKIFV